MDLVSLPLARFRLCKLDRWNTSARERGSLRRKVRDSFTLVEMLVAIAVLTVLLVLASQIIARTSSVWVYSNSKMTEGREARVAFNSLVSRLSEATVDQYYGYTNSGTPPLPVAYLRRSELRFVSGISSAMNTTVTSSPTDAVFFAAPLGIVSDTADYGHLPSLLNVCGYYVQWSNNDSDRPSPPLPAGNGMYRFRLMQFVQPAEAMSIYSQTIPFGTVPAGNYPNYGFINTSAGAGTPWQNTALNNAATTGGIHPLANNVIALLLLPSMSTTDSSGTLAPGFLYNSEAPTPPATTPALTSMNRTPPVMRVVMYTIDEKSATRLTQLSTMPAMPNLYVDTSSNPIFTDPSKLYPNTTSGDIGDLARFEATLTKTFHLTFRRFDAAIQLPKQIWNTNN